MTAVADFGLSLQLPEGAAHPLLSFPLIYCQHTHTPSCTVADFGLSLQLPEGASHVSGTFQGTMVSLCVHMCVCVCMRVRACVRVFVCVCTDPICMVEGIVVPSYNSIRHTLHT